MTETGTETTFNQAERPSEDERTRLANARQTVLVVEDDPGSREPLTEALSTWGYEVLAVGSAEEAEFAVKNKSLHAALIDVFLPGKSGATLMTRLRERFPKALLVGMSALSDGSMSRRLKGVGADIFIGKPISLDGLSKALKAPHISWH